MDNTEWEIVRNDSPKPTFSILEELWVEEGNHQDWLLLSNLHYKMQSVPVGARYYRLRHKGQTIGVAVIGMSRPLLKERHALFPKLTPGNDTQMSNIHRYKVVNNEFRVIGRMVIDTMYRSGGVAYRFANLVSRMHGYKYMEIQSSMSKYNTFAHKAGFTFVKPIKSPNYDKGLKFMRKWFSAHPGDQEALMEEYETMSSAMKKRVEKELKDFYYKHSPLEKTGSRRFYSDHVVENWPVRRTIAKIQGLCFASPLYGIYKNPDLGTEIPKKLPLLAFDFQKTTEPLNIDKLNSFEVWTALKKTIEENDWSKDTVISSETYHVDEESEDFE